MHSKVPISRYLGYAKPGRHSWKLLLKKVRASAEVHSDVWDVWKARGRVRLGCVALRCVELSCVRCRKEGPSRSSDSNRDSNK